MTCIQMTGRPTRGTRSAMCRPSSRPSVVAYTASATPECHIRSVELFIVPLIVCLNYISGFQDFTILEFAIVRAFLPENVANAIARFQIPEIENPQILKSSNPEIPEARHSRAVLIVCHQISLYRQAASRPSLAR